MVFVAVSTNPKKSSIEKCKKYGIGILSIKDETVEEILSPIKRTETWNQYIDHILKNLNTGYFQKGLSGLPNMKGTGPAQNILKLVEEERIKNPKIKWKELFENIPNHYSSHTSMAQSMKMAKDRSKN